MAQVETTPEVGTTTFAGVEATSTGAVIPHGKGGATDTGGEPPADAVESEVLHDLRHAVGNHFHKLFYWADRIESEGDAGRREQQLTELNGALQRFQEYLELGLRYFEPQSCSLISMTLGDVAAAAASVLREHTAPNEVSVVVADGQAEEGIRLDPQRLSLALRLVVDLLGGRARECFECDFDTVTEEGVVGIRIVAQGGQVPLEIPMLERAIAQKAVQVQGGRLELVQDGQEPVGGYTLYLPSAG